MADNYIKCEVESGSISISEDVITDIIRACVSESGDVASLSAVPGTEIAEYIGIKNLSKSIKVQNNNGKIVVDVVVSVKYGCNIVNVARKLQEHVINAVNSATGLSDIEVNVHVSGIEFEK